jgi:hypothetical protein
VNNALQHSRVFIAEIFTGKKSYQFVLAHLAIGWYNQTTSNTLKMGTESVPEPSQKLRILSRLSAQENLRSPLSAGVSKPAFLLLSAM